MVYEDININIRRLLDEQKICFLEKSQPIYLYSPLKNEKSYILTAPHGYEALQLVGEFDKEPGRRNLTTCYAVLGKKVKEISLDTFLEQLFDKSGTMIENSELSTFYQENIDSDDHDLCSRQYIEYCTKLAAVKKASLLVIKDLTEAIQKQKIE